MFQPETYFVSLSFMLISMLCWGSWANTMKLCPGYRFQLYYWDYAIGLIVAAVMWGSTLGSFGGTGRSCFSDIAHAGLHPVLLAMTGGVIFNIANLLLVAAIDIAGLAVAFPIGIGLALVVGAIGSYVISPAGNPLLLFGGIALVAAAIVLDAVAYRLREANRPAMSLRGIVISLIAGLLMGCFYPFVSKAMTGQSALGPYAALLFFVLGVAACSIPVNYLLMRMPLDERLLANAGELAPVGCPGRGGVVHRRNDELCGFAGAHCRTCRVVLHRPGCDYDFRLLGGLYLEGVCIGSRAALAWMFVFFLCGLTAIAVAPLFS